MMKRQLAIIALGCMSMLVAAQPGPPFGRSQHNQIDDEAAPWRELEIEPPAFPQQQNLVEIYVSAVATNRYLVDSASLSVGEDGVVRYVLVVEAAGGSRNVSFEGIHCKERRWKHYATGHGSGSTWVKSRSATAVWRSIENKPVNRHHAALSRDLFCPMGNPIRSADDGRNALRLGRHPNAV